MTEPTPFDGTLIDVPFGTAAVHSVTVEQFRQLSADHDPDDVLVLTGSPTSVTTFEALLTDECPGATLPRVATPIVHATEVLTRTDDRAILSDAMRRELVHRFLADWEWETPYFRRAAEHESFVGDVAQLLETATWQACSFESTPALQEVGAIREAFHAWLEAHDHLERGQLISLATDVLADGTRRDEVLDAEAVLVVEFEEFLETDRRYLEQIADGRQLVCLAEADSSVRRTWAEPGPITDYVSFSAQRSVDPIRPTTRPAATAAFFARGEIPAEPDDGEVCVIAVETAADEVDAVAEEIERLCERPGMEYGDVAVAVKHSGQAVIDVICAFEQAGIPTTSATVVGFGDDPAIREVLQVVDELASDADEGSGSAAETSVLDEEFRAELSDMPHLGNALRAWATRSNLKARVASRGSPLDHRAQFGDIRRAFTMADFLEETDFLEATWESLAAMLRRAHDHAAQETQTSSIDGDGGVRVDHVRALKNGSFDVVFVLAVVDSTYPGDPAVGRVFPLTRLTDMPEYPGVTQVDRAAVESTFATDSTTSSRPFRQYHAEHARRHLAIAASIATERMYVCLHTHEGTALDERVQPSRFVTEAYQTLPWLTETAETELRTERAAEAYLLSRIDRALADVRRANSQDVSVSLDDVEAEFAEIQSLLDQSGERGDRLRDAMRARLDFAAGRVSRE